MNILLSIILEEIIGALIAVLIGQAAKRRRR